MVSERADYLAEKRRRRDNLAVAVLEAVRSWEDAAAALADLDDATNDDRAIADVASELLAEVRVWGKRP